MKHMLACSLLVLGLVQTSIQAQQSEPQRPDSRARTDNPGPPQQSALPPISSFIQLDSTIYRERELPIYRPGATPTIPSGLLVPGGVIGGPWFTFDPRSDNQYQTFELPDGATQLFGFNERIGSEWEQRIRPRTSSIRPWGMGSPRRSYAKRSHSTSSGRCIADGPTHQCDADAEIARPEPWMFRIDPVRLITAQELATMPKAKTGPRLITEEELASLSKTTRPAGPAPRVSPTLTDAATRSAR